MDTAGGAAPQTGTLDNSATTTAQTTITTGLQTNTSNILLGTFLTASNQLESGVIISGLWDINLYAISSTFGCSYYGIFDYVDSDGVSNPVLLADGTAGAVSIGPAEVQ
jgi:hypothetical protein